MDEYIESRVVNGSTWGVVYLRTDDSDEESEVRIDRLDRGGATPILESLPVSEIDDLISILRKTKKTVTKGR